MKKQCECCLSSKHLKELSEYYTDLIDLCFSIKVPITCPFDASSNFICNTCAVIIAECSAFRSQILTSQATRKEYFSSKTSNNETNESKSKFEPLVKIECLSDYDDELDFYGCLTENNNIDELNVQINPIDESTEKTFEHKQPSEEKILKVVLNRLEKPNSQQIEQIFLPELPESNNLSIEKDNSGFRIIKIEEPVENLVVEVPIDKNIICDDYFVHDSENNSFSDENSTFLTFSEDESNLNEGYPSIAESNEIDVTESHVNHEKFNYTPSKLDKTARTCEVCNETFHAHKLLVLHMAVHYPNFICDICKKPFVTRSSLCNHIKRHQLEKNQKCHICDKVYSNIVALKKHTKRIHLKILSHRCDLCNRSFHEKAQLNKHLQKHSGEKNYECNICHKRFTENRLLNAHVNNYHMKNRTHVCEVCGKSFFDRNNWNRHQYVHSENVFECDTCKKKFKRKSNLIEHMSLHPNGPKAIRIKCAYCDKIYNSRKGIRSHMKKIHKTVMSVST